MKQPKPSGVKWVIEEPVEDWLNMFPNLRSRLLKTECSECKRFLEPHFPFICGDYAGIETYKCNCGAHPVTILCRRDKT